MLHKSMLNEKKLTNTLNVKNLVLVKYFSNLLIEIVNLIDDKQLLEGEKQQSPFLKFIKWYIESCWVELRNITYTLKNKNNTFYKKRIEFHNRNQKQLVNSFKNLISMISVSDKSLSILEIKKLTSISTDNYNSITQILTQQLRLYNLISPVSLNKDQLFINGLKESAISSSHYENVKKKLLETFQECHSWTHQIRETILNSLEKHIKNTLGQFIEQSRLLLKKELGVDLFYISPKKEIFSLLFSELHLIQTLHGYFVPCITHDFLKDFEKELMLILKAQHKKLKKVEYATILYEINNPHLMMSEERLSEFVMKGKNKTIRITMPPEVGFKYMKIFELEEEQIKELAYECVQRDEALNSLGLKIFQCHIETNKSIADFPVQKLEQLKPSGALLFIKKYLDSLGNDRIIHAINQRCFTFALEKKSAPLKTNQFKLPPSPAKGILKVKSEVDKQNSHELILPKEKKEISNYSKRAQIRHSDFFINYSPKVDLPQSNKVYTIATMTPASLSREKSREKISNMWKKSTENKEKNDKPSQQTKSP